MCSSGEFYLSSRNPGPTQPGTPPRDPIWLCYLYHLPAVAWRLRVKDGHALH